jgi:hypothetical protein
VNRSGAGRAYFTVNAILAGVIMLIMGYSAFYSPDRNDYPVVCIHEKLTGEPCPSCGLSHAFSLIVRGRFEEAMEWNTYSIRIFLFFAIQLLMRIAFGIRSLMTDRRIKQLTVADAVVSGVMVIVTFYPFMRVLWVSLF